MSKRVHSKDAPYIKRGFQVDFNTLIFTPREIILQSGSIVVAESTDQYRDEEGIVPGGSLMQYNTTSKKYEYYDGTFPAIGILGKDTDVYDGDAQSFLYLGNFGVYTEMIPNAADNDGKGLLDLGAVEMGAAIFVAGPTDSYKSEETLTEAGAASLKRPTLLDGSVTFEATLADGLYVGQRKFFVMSEATATVTLSIANHVTSAPEVATFNALDEVLELQWLGAKWETVFATATFV
jgi:hypothetical protein